MRLIDADALLKEIEDWHDSLGGTMNPSDWGVQNVLQSVMDYIIEAEDIEAEPVRHGRWVNTRKSYYYHSHETEVEEQCSLCGRIVYRYDTQPQDFYCHHCGAKMDGGASE